MTGESYQKMAEMLKHLKVTVTTSTFWPSVVLLVMIPVTITYFVLKQKYKKEIKNEAK